MGSLSSSFTITFISGTDSLYVEEQVVKFKGDNSSVESPGSLLQVYYTDTGGVTPDWTETTNQPCLKLGLTKSSTGANIALTTGCSFQYQGEDIEFGSSVTSLNGMSWYTSTDGMFMVAYTDTSEGADSYVYLRICANIASSDITTNQQITYSLAYSDTDFGSGEITSTTDILIREGSSSSLYCNILCTTSELSTDTTYTTLSVQYIYGGAEYSKISAVNAAMKTTYTLSWQKDGQAIGVASETLTVYREEDDDSGAVTGNYVDGCNVFTVLVLDGNGDTIASDSQRITDVADEFRVKLTETGTIRSNKSVTVKGILYQGDEAYSGSVTYTTSVYNAINEQTGADASTTGTSGFSRSISATECVFEDSEGNTQYDDCILVVQCQI